MNAPHFPKTCAVLALYAVSVTSVFGQSYGVSTYAGANSLKDNASATEKFLRRPQGVVADANGNIYLADGADNRIRRVTPGGIITTIAGTGRGGYFGDGGPAIESQLNSPINLALDRKRGLLYVADYENLRVRQINLQTGIIRLVAGNGKVPFTSAGPDAGSVGMSPNGVAVDSDGNLYISDDANNRIYKVVVATGALSVIAGTGEFDSTGDNGPANVSKFAGPTAMAMDAANNLYFIDYYASRVRKINLSTLVMTAVAGDGFLGSDGDGGPATRASILYPDAIAVDDAGNVLISEALQIRIVKAGIITKLAGTKVRGFTGDGGGANQARIGFAEGLATLSGDDYVIADTENHRLRKVTLSIINTIAGGDVKDGGAATAAYLSSPHGIIKDAAGNLIVTDSENYLVRKVATGGQISSIAGAGLPGSPIDRVGYGRGMAYDSRGNLYIADSSNNRIMILPTSGTMRVYAGPSNGASGLSAEGGLATTARFFSPKGVAIDSNDNVYVADWGNNRIRKIDASALTVTTFAGNGKLAYSGDGGPATAAGFSPAALLFDRQGNLLIADDSNNRIRRIEITTGRISTIAGDGTAGTTGDNVAATATSLYYPEALAVDAQNNIYVGRFGYVLKVAASSPSRTSANSIVSSTSAANAYVSSSRAVRAWMPRLFM